LIAGLSGPTPSSTLNTLEQQTTTAKIKIEAHKNERRKLKLTPLVRAVHAARALGS